MSPGFYCCECLRWMGKSAIHWCYTIDEDNGLICCSRCVDYLSYYGTPIQGTRAHFLKVFGLQDAKS